MIRYTLLLFILISSVTVLVVLGLDLDLLLNGPKYISKVITNILNRFHQEEIIEEEYLREALMEASQSLYLHLPLLLIVILSILILGINCLGCTGACLLSYSLLSGFVIFTLVIFILFLALTLWIFLSDMEDSVIDSFVSEKISEYNSSQDLFNLVIDTVQRDLQCCGFKSASDWSGEYPHSCCDKVQEECGEENIYNSTCKEDIRSNLLQPTSVLGVIGVTLLAVLAAVGVTTLLSLCLCLVARRHRGERWSPRSEEESSSQSVSSLELSQPQPRFLRN